MAPLLFNQNNIRQSSFDFPLIALPRKTRVSRSSGQDGQMSSSRDTMSRKSGRQKPLPDEGTRVAGKAPGGKFLFVPFLLKEKGLAVQGETIGKLE